MKCSICNTTNQYHAKSCPNKEIKTAENFVYKGELSQTDRDMIDQILAGPREVIEFDVTDPLMRPYLSLYYDSLRN